MHDASGPMPGTAGTAEHAAHEIKYAAEEIKNAYTDGQPHACRRASLINALDRMDAASQFLRDALSDPYPETRPLGSAARPTRRATMMVHD